MGKHGSPDFKFEVAQSGGAMADMSQYIDEINEINVEALLQEGHAFGDSWVKQLFTGVKQGQAVTVSGFYDDTVTVGPDAIFNALGDERKCRATYDGETGNKYTEFMAVITNYVRTPTRGEKTRYSCTLTPTGEMSEDSAL